MAGRRRPALGVERIATGIRSGSASPFTAGGLVQASPITGLDRTDARRRDLIPFVTAAPSPVFSVAGAIEVRTYDMPFYNVTGIARVITGLSAAVGDVPQGSAATVRLLDGGLVVAAVTIADGDNLGGTVTGLAHAWLPDRDLVVQVTAVGSVSPGADLVVQVLTA